MGGDRIDAILQSLRGELMHEPSRSYFERHRRRYRHDLREVAALYSRGEVLEVGALPCHLTYGLRALGVPVIGVDLEPGRLEAFIAKHELSIVRCDIERERMPFEDRRFAMAIFNEVFEHLRIDPIHVLLEIHRVLEPNGVMMLSTPNLYSLRNVVSFVRGRGIGDAYGEFEKLRTTGHMGHVREYTAAEVVKFLERTGFRVREVRYVKHDASYFGAGADVLCKLWPKVRPYLVIIAEKT